MPALLFDLFNRCSLIKKWIGKGMSNIYYWEKMTFSKLVGKVNFSERKSEEMRGIFGENFVLILLSSTAICLQNRVLDFF